MSTAKKQHFVPQFLLKNFAQGKDNKERLWVFDKKRCASFQSSVRDTAHENQFYEGRNLDGAEIEAESLTQYVDGIGASALREVVEQQRLPLSGVPFVSLSYFVAAQMHRVPAVRNELDFIRKSIIKKWGPDVRHMNDERGIGEYSEADSKFSSIAALVEDVPKIALLLQGKVWFLAMSPKAAFILSDNPVVSHNHIDYGPRGSLGLAQVGIEINFPVSPNLALLLLCPKIAELFALTPEGHNRLVRQKKGIPVHFEKDNVEFVNSLQVIRSERFVYAQREEDLQIAREMVTEKPDLARPASEKIVSED